jgi:hypothetical protein
MRLSSAAVQGVVLRLMAAGEVHCLCIAAACVYMPAWCCRGEHPCPCC